VTRNRPLWCGVVVGIGFLNRELRFTDWRHACIAVLDRDLFSRAGGARFGRIVGVAATTWLSVQGLMQLSSASGPGTSAADTFSASNNLLELAFSAAGYLFGRCGEITLLSIKYELLSVLGIVGLGGWFLAATAPGALRIAWTVVLAAWMAIVTIPHVHLAAEYRTNPPVPPKVELIRALDAEGIRYGIADYWLAYYIDFMTNERIVIASTTPQRILMYNAIVAEHSGEAVRLLRKPCDGGKHLTAGVYKCP
jgi:hypothetical protein